MEAIFAPQGADHWDEMGIYNIFVVLYSKAGEKMVLEDNYFIEEILPNTILYNLVDADMAEYRRPFL
jgi:haloalkane dehalogenase